MKKYLVVYQIDKGYSENRVLDESEIPRDENGNIKILTLADKFDNKYWKVVIINIIPLNI